MRGTDDLFTVQEAADFLRVHPETVRIWLRQEKLHGSKLNRRAGWRISRRELNLFVGSEAYLAAQTNRLPRERVRTEGRARVIGVFNQSGGVGKTTLTRDIGYALHMRGFRVLLVDCDPQATLTIFAGFQPEDLQSTVYDAVLQKAALPILSPWGLSMVPANIGWAGAEVEIQRLPMGREKRLRVALEPYLASYDFVFLDCPPSLGQISYNALYASEELLIPVQAEYKGTMATKYLFDTISDVREYGNPELEILGVVPTMLGANTQSRLMYEALLDQLSPRIPVLAPVRRLVVFADASEKHLPVQMYRPENRDAIDDIARVADAVLGIVARREVVSSR
jgi:chromosome partitioning protein